MSDADGASPHDYPDDRELGVLDPAGDVCGERFLTVNRPTHVGCTSVTCHALAALLERAIQKEGV
jgi:hypothetical protein